MAGTRMTQAAYNSKLKELNFRLNEKKNEIDEQIKYAKSLGDFSENAELDSAKETERANLQRIAELQDEIDSVEIIPSIVYTIYDYDDEEEYTYTVVGPTESDVLNNMISEDSPLGRAVKGKKVGDDVLVKTPDGFYKIKIKDIVKE